MVAKAWCCCKAATSANIAGLNMPASAAVHEDAGLDPTGEVG